MRFSFINSARATGTLVCRGLRVLDISPRIQILPGTKVDAEPSYGRKDEPGADDFENLVAQHYGSLYRFAMSLSGSESDAGDLVQDTFLTWAAKGRQLRDVTKRKSWLFTTLHRRFLEGRRRMARFPHVEIDDTTDELPHVDPDLVSHLDAGLAIDLLQKVDPQFQAPLALFYLEDSPYQEIADILEIPIGTVKSRIARGLKQLKGLVLKRADTWHLREDRR